MSLVFDHGVSVPLRVDLFRVVRDLLTDLTGPSGDADPTTQYGPVLRTVTRWPWEVSKLMTSEAGVRYFLEVLTRDNPPFAAVYVGDSQPDARAAGQLNPLRLDATTRVHVYLVDGHRAGRISGRYEPDDVDDRRPGLDAMEDLVMSRLYRNGSTTWQDLTWLGTSDVWASPDHSIRDVTFDAHFGYLVCRPRDPELIDEIVVNHDVQGGGEPLVTQKKVF